MIEHTSVVHRIFRLLREAARKRLARRLRRS
jgi:hypothetical protein